MELQTERLQQETGAVAIESRVHLHNRDRRQRLATLLSTDKNGQKLPQSVAYTRLTTQFWDPSILAVDSLLENHNLMGKTFKQAGYDVRQNRLLRIRFPLLSRSLARLYHCPFLAPAEIECFEFWADEKLYGIVLEIKNPRRHEAPWRPRKGYYPPYRAGWWKKHAVLTRIIAQLLGVGVSAILYARCRIALRCQRTIFRTIQ